MNLMGGIQMNEQVKDYIDKYPSEIVDMYLELRQLIFDSVSCKTEETLWAKLPSYYVGDSVVRLIPFKDHINIEAQALINYKDILGEENFEFFKQLCYEKLNVVNEKSE